MLKKLLPLLVFVLFFSAAHAQVTKAMQHYSAGIQLRDNNTVR